MSFVVDADADALELELDEDELDDVDDDDDDENEEEIEENEKEKLLELELLELDDELLEDDDDDELVPVLVCKLAGPNTSVSSQLCTRLPRSITLAVERVSKFFRRECGRFKVVARFRALVIAREGRGFLAFQDIDQLYSLAARAVNKNIDASGS
ncbi:MAG: hypothetical protein U0136_05745 [Bdellovibrionota bacterium]